MLFFLCFLCSFALQSRQSMHLDGYAVRPTLPERAHTSKQPRVSRLRWLFLAMWIAPGRWAHCSPFTRTEIGAPKHSGKSFFPRTVCTSTAILTRTSRIRAAVPYPDGDARAKWRANCAATGPCHLSPHAGRVSQRPILVAGPVPEGASLCHSGFR